MEPIPIGIDCKFLFVRQLQAWLFEGIPVASTAAFKEAHYDMESKAKLVGHPLHPMLVVFPLGLLVTSIVFDCIHRKTKKEDPAKVAHAMIGAGVLSGVLAALPGIIDWMAIPHGTRAKQIGLWHGGGNVLVLLLFGLSWLQRRRDPAHPSNSALALSVAGVLLGNGTAWLGGELVHRLNVSVDEGAHLDAPNSLIEHAA